MVARISTYLARCNINIEDIEQRVVEGLFIMTMLVDLSELTMNLDELILDLKRIGEEIHMDVAIRLHGQQGAEADRRPGQSRGRTVSSGSSPIATPGP